MDVGDRATFDPDYESEPLQILRTDGPPGHGETLASTYAKAMEEEAA